MNILCKLFGHRMYFVGSNIFGPSYCVRWRCNHKEDAHQWRLPMMPKCKPPKKDKEE